MFFLINKLDLEKYYLQKFELFDQVRLITTKKQQYNSPERGILSNIVTVQRVTNILEYLNIQIYLSQISICTFVRTVSEGPKFGQGGVYRAQNCSTRSLTGLRIFWALQVF